MRSIRAGKGLGDALYLQAVARHLSRKERLRVCSGWPDVFRNLNVEVVPFTRQADINAHYTLRKWRTDTDQFEDCCIQAGIKEPVDFRIDWEPSKSFVPNRIKPVVLVLIPRMPMDRADGFARELLPRQEAYQAAVDGLKGLATLVLVGSGHPLYELDGIDVDLTNRTSVSELLDMASQADGFLGYCSFFVPLAESFNKPGLFVWGRAGLKSRTPYIRQITPTKILHRDSSLYVIDDQPIDVLPFLGQVEAGRDVQGQAGGFGWQRARLAG